MISLAGGLIGLVLGGLDRATTLVIMIVVIV